MRLDPSHPITDDLSMNPGSTCSARSWYWSPGWSPRVPETMNVHVPAYEPWNDIASPGCAYPTTPRLLESRMGNERRTSASEGGHGKPTAATPHGAHGPPSPSVLLVLTSPICRQYNRNLEYSHFLELRILSVVKSDVHHRRYAVSGGS